MAAGAKFERASLIPRTALCVVGFWSSSFNRRLFGLVSPSFVFATLCGSVDDVVVRFVACVCVGVGVALGSVVVVGVDVRGVCAGVGVMRCAGECARGGVGTRVVGGVRVGGEVGLGVGVVLKMDVSVPVVWRLPMPFRQVVMIVNGDLCIASWSLLVTDSITL